MDCIESILLVGATIACVVATFSATVIVGVKVQSSLADLIHEGPSNRPRNQNQIEQGEATVFTGVITVVITVVLAIVALFIEFVKLYESGHTVTMDLQQNHCQGMR
jgi:hypothetical protein